MSIDFGGILSYFLQSRKGEKEFLYRTIESNHHLKIAAARRGADHKAITELGMADVLSYLELGGY